MFRPHITGNFQQVRLDAEMSQVPKPQVQVQVQVLKTNYQVQRKYQYVINKESNSTSA